MSIWKVSLAGSQPRARIRTRRHERVEYRYMAALGWRSIHLHLPFLMLHVSPPFVRMPACLRKAGIVARLVSSRSRGRHRQLTEMYEYIHMYVCLYVRLERGNSRFQSHVHYKSRYNSRALRRRSAFRPSEEASGGSPWLRKDNRNHPRYSFVGSVQVVLDGLFVMHTHDVTDDVTDAVTDAVKRTIT